MKPYHEHIESAEYWIQTAADQQVPNEMDFMRFIALAQLHLAIATEIRTGVGIQGR